MPVIDLNADLGEAETQSGQAVEAEILRYVSSANVACGGHAGNRRTMETMTRLCKQLGLNMGAHPSWPDRNNFGRKAMKLGHDISEANLKDSLMGQITMLVEIAAQLGQPVAYVKPHGALYNQSVSSEPLADIIAQSVKALDEGLILMGAPNSQLKAAAERAGLRFIAEGFIDRTYSDEGHLVSRDQPGAVISTDPAREQQALSLSLKHQAVTQSGHPVSVHAQSLCIHSDTPGAAQTARRVRAALKRAGVTIKAFA